MPLVDISGGVLVPLVDISGGVLVPLVDISGGVLVPLVDISGGVLVPLVEALDKLLKANNDVAIKVHNSFLLMNCIFITPILVD